MDNLDRPGGGPLPAGEAAQDELNHHQRPVYDDAEIQSAQAEQAGMISPDLHRQEGKQ